MISVRQERLKDELQKNPELVLPSQIVISNDLKKSLLEAINVSPTEVVSTTSLILAVAQNSRVSREILNVLAAIGTTYLENLEQTIRETPVGDTSIGAIITIDGQDIPISTKVRTALAVGHILSLDDPIESKEYLLAESLRPNSPFIVALKSFGVPTPEKVVSSLIEEKHQKEPGYNLASCLNTPSRKTQETKPSDKTTTETVATPSGVADLTREKGILENAPELVWPQEVLKIIRTLDGSNFLVLITPSPYQSWALVSELAVTIAEDENHTLPYKTLLTVETNGSPQNLPAKIDIALTKGKSGIIYLPKVPSVEITEKGSPLFQAIRNGQSKSIITMDEQTWRQLPKKDLYSLATPLFLERLIQKKLEKSLMQNKGRLEKKFKLKLDDDVLKELAAVATKYPSDVFPLLETIASGVKLGKSERIKTRLSLRYGPDEKVDIKDLYLALNQLTGIDASPENPQRFLEMEKALNKRVVGQPDAIHVVTEAIIIEKGGLKEPNRPIGVFIFIGPTGVGKTELGRALAEFLFGDENAMIRLDMSEYQEKHSLARLIGAPPGYVGYEAGGQLTEAIRRRPYSVTLVDEFEKAHPDVLKAFLQINDEGRLTDGQGQTFDFKNGIMIYTGNVGTALYELIDKTGPDGKVITREMVAEAVIRELKASCPPEFLNRIDAIVVFNPLTKDNLFEITGLQAAKLEKMLSSQGIGLEIGEDVKKWLVDKTFDPTFGARPLVRGIRTHIRLPIAKERLRSNLKFGDTIQVTLENNAVKIARKA